jgi:GPI mannosyltransferase 3
MRIGYCVGVRCPGPKRGGQLRSLLQLGRAGVSQMRAMVSRAQGRGPCYLPARAHPVLASEIEKASAPVSTHTSSSGSPTSMGAVETTRFVLALLFLFAAALRLALSLSDDGIYWPDEVYQSLEPAHRLVFGYGLRPWEFIQGARNWAFPGMVAGLMQISTWLFGAEPLRYLTAIRLAFSAISLLTAWGTIRLARSAGATELGALLAGSLYALSPPLIYFAPRALSESASAAAVVFGLALLLDRKTNLRTILLGASLLGLSVLFRLQNALFCVGALTILLARRKRSEAVLTGSVLVAWALIYGALDRITWGYWFNSLLEYLRFNLVEGKSSRWGSSGPAYYLQVLWTSMPLVTACLIPLVLAAARRASQLLWIVLAYLVIHSCVGHKEFRFVVPALPLLYASAGVGFGIAVARFRLAPRATAAVLGACGLIAASKFHELTFGDLGQYDKLRANDSAFDDHGPLNRLLLVAHDQQDLCGLAIYGADLAWTGGYSYLHRHVPVYSAAAAVVQSHFNYALVAGTFPGHRVASEGRYQLVRLPQANCTLDPNYQWLLP